MSDKLQFVAHRPVTFLLPRSLYTLKDNGWVRRTSKERSPQEDGGD